MSVLSAKRDRLRERAEEMRFLAPDPDVPYLVPSTKETMALAMRSAASEMEDAADTIWQLRNTNLDTANENDQLKAENAKLRKLMQDTYDCICEMYDYMDGGYAYEDAEADPAYGPILKRMRELRVFETEGCDE